MNNGDQKSGNSPFQIQESQKKIINRLAPGFRFMPTDTELFEEFLLKRLKKEPLPANNIIESDIYKCPPDQFKGRFLPNGVNNYEWYFFSPRALIQGEGDKMPRTTKQGKGNRRAETTKQGKGDRMSRVVEWEGDQVGYWNATGGRKLTNGEPLPRNLKITKLKYISGSRSSPVMTNWHMTEYRINPEHEKLRGMSKVEDLVLCKIYKKLDKFEKDYEDEVDITEVVAESELKFNHEGQFFNNYNKVHHGKQEFYNPLAPHIGPWGPLPPLATLSAPVSGGKGHCLLKAAGQAGRVNDQNGNNGRGHLKTPYLSESNNGLAGPGQAGLNYNNLGSEQSGTDPNLIGLSSTSEAAGPSDLVDLYPELLLFGNQEEASLQFMSYFNEVFGGPKDGVQ